MHGIELGSNGQAAFASLREPAWHQLGTVFENPVSTAEMLSLAYMSGWDVRLESAAEIFNLVGNYEFNEDKLAVVRNHPFKNGANHIVGWVGGRYQIVQNEQLFTLADGILDGGGQWETAGSIKNGSVVFGSLSIDRDIIVGAGEANDVTKLYLMVTSSFNGSTAVTGGITPVRVVCQNTLNMALPGLVQKFKFRHTQSVEGRMQEARKAMGLTFKYADAFEKEANELYEREVTKQQFDDIIKVIYTSKEDAQNSVTRAENKRDLLMQIWEGDTSEGIRGTAWGALNTLTEHIDWHRKPRTDNPTGVLEGASGFVDTVTKQKNDIREAVLMLTA